jgi:hypothetical protein
MSFKLNDVVSWNSASAGIWKEKTGTVVEVVKAGKAPAHEKSDWFSRDHESYVVSVPSGGKAKPKIYWPRVSALKLSE